MKISVEYQVLESGNLVLKNIQDPERGLIEVEMRDLRYEDIQILQSAQAATANVVDETYKLLASLIVRWGDLGSVTTLELRSKGFRMYKLLESALQEFFLPQFEFFDSSQAG